MWQCMNTPRSARVCVSVCVCACAHVCESIIREIKLPFQENTISLNRSHLIKTSNHFN